MIKHVDQAHDQSETVIHRRTRYDLRYKARVIHRYAELVKENQGIVLAGMQTAVAKEFNIDRRRVSDWLRDKELIVEESKEGGGKKKCVYKFEKAKFPDEEDMLFDAVYIRRQLFGLWVDRYWLCDQFAEILEESQPKGWDVFKYSKGWVSNFCTRYNIRKQYATNKKDMPIQMKEQLVKKFHRDWLAVQRGAPNDLTYGRFDGYHLFHWYQSPLEFAHPGKSTLNIRGTPCWMWYPGSGTDKRFISLQMCIRPWGKQIIKPIIIFRGQGIYVSQEERAMLDELTNIRYYFQPKAWADGEFCLWCLDSFKADLLEAKVGGEVALGLDGLAAQKTAAFRNKATGLNILPFYTPPDCTDVIAPCDHHVFLKFKKLIQEFYRQVSQAQRAIWADCKDNSSLTLSLKRIQIAQWVSAAWDELCTNHEQLFLHAFTSTGFLMKLAEPGADIKITGLDGYPGPGQDPF